MSFFSQLTDRIAQLSDFLSSANSGGAINGGKKSTALDRFKLNFNSWLAGGAATTAASDSALHKVSSQVDTWRSDGDEKKKIQRPAVPNISAPKIDASSDDQPKRGFEPYQLIIVVPEKQEMLSYEQMETAIIRDVFNRNNIGYSRASLEEIAEKEKLDFSPRYNYEKKVYEFNEADGLRRDYQPELITVDGKTVRAVRLTIRADVREGIAQHKALSETIKASGKKTFAELDLNERMKMAMQMSFDKHYTPHSVSEAVQNIDPKTMLAGVAVVGGLVYALTKAGAGKAIPYLGAGVTLAQLTYYYGEADSFLQACKNARSPEELDAAAKTFGNLVQQGGVDVILTATAVGAANIGKISRAGGNLIGLIETGIKNAQNKINQYGDEITAGMRQTFGDNLVTVNNAPLDDLMTTTKNNPLDDINKPMEARRTPAELASDLAARPERAEKYAELVQSNKPWEWSQIDKKITKKEKEAIKELAVKEGLIPQIYVDPKTGFADFTKFVIREAKLPKELWNKSDDIQFRWLDKQIGGRPKGYTWHHHQDEGRMQLVEFGVHNVTNHNGGRSVWAGGKR